MKKHWILALIILGCGAAASGLLWLHQPPCHPTDWLASELKLTADQQKQLDALEKDFTGKCSKSCAEMCTARNALAQELKLSSTVTPKVEELLRKMQLAQASTEHETVEHLLRIKAILTPDQQSRYIELITGRLCNACPHCQHRVSQPAPVDSAK